MTPELKALKALALAFRNAWNTFEKVPSDSVFWTGYDFTNSLDELELQAQKWFEKAENAYLYEELEDIEGVEK